MASGLLNPLLAVIERELRPEPDRAAEAERRATALVEELRTMERARMFEVREAIPHGSHARGTAIAGFKDIDYLVVLDPESLQTAARRPRTPSDTVQRMARLLRERRAGLVNAGTLEVRAQQHSVGIKYPASRLRVDLVPALRTPERGCFLIPNRAFDEWIETRPHQLKRRLTAAEQRNSNVRPVIRLIKGWRRARGKAMRLPSYAVELLVADGALQEPRYTELVRRFFASLASADARQRLVLLGSRDATPVTVRDPSSGANVADELTAEHRGRLIANARTALDALAEAEDLAAEGRGRAALGVLRRTFVGNHR